MELLAAILFGFTVFVPALCQTRGVTVKIKIEDKTPINILFTETHFKEFYECLSDKKTQSCEVFYHPNTYVVRLHLRTEIEKEHHTNYYVCQVVTTKAKIVCLRQRKGSRDANSQIFHYVLADKSDGANCVGIVGVQGNEFHVLDSGDDVIQKCKYDDSDEKGVNPTIVTGVVLGLVIFILFIVIACLLLLFFFKRRNSTCESGAPQSSKKRPNENVPKEKSKISPSRKDEAPPQVAGNGQVKHCDSSTTEISQDSAHSTAKQTSIDNQNGQYGNLKATKDH